MAHLIVHAGFHKTGTTSVQKTLRKNRRVLRPFAQVVLRPGMLALCEAARAFSVKRDPLDLALVTYEAATLAGGLARDKPVILSSEDLSGHMPGRRGLKDYSAAPELMATIVAAFAEVIPDARIDLFFSTRGAEAWLKSCYVQHVRATRMTLNFKDYARIFRKSANLDGIIDRVAEVATGALVHRHPLESLPGDFGPVTPLLNLAGVPQNIRAQMVPVPPANRAPSDAVLQEILTLNQSDLEAHDWKVARLKLNGKGA